VSSKVFVSYVQENRDVVTRLVYELRDAGLNVWFDRDTLPPGVFWRDEIRAAVRNHEYFLACFSNEYLVRPRTFMNEELLQAIEEIRQRANAPWFVPIVLSGEVPDLPISAGRTLRDIQFVDLSGDSWSSGMERLVYMLQKHVAITPANTRTPASGDESDLDDGEDDWAGIDLDAQVLHRFLNENRLARHLDAKIARHSKSGALHEISPLTLDKEVAALAALGIHNTAQIERGLRKYKRIIDEWSEEWLGGAEAPISQGISLTYLAYVILAAKGDTQGLLNFAGAANIHPADERLVQRVMTTYRRLARFHSVSTLQ
jgi:hypothetical protein